MLYRLFNHMTHEYNQLSDLRKPLESILSSCSIQA